ncbi:sensor histidine kinase [Pyxidicoccus sp. 3LFB2]
MSVLSLPAARSAPAVTADGATRPCVHGVLQRHLLQVAGHELRNPLGIVTGTVSRLLASEPLSAQQQRLLARLETTTRRMTRLVEDLLNERLLEEGASLPVLPRLCDLRQLCEQATRDVAEGASRVRLESQGDCHGAWDPDRLQQLLGNLLDNALKYSPRDTDVLLRCTGGGETVTVEVHNWGAPVPAALMPHLFDPLRRARGEHGQEGWGLGLFISQHIVLAHGGSLEAHSSVSEGTRFTVSLPRGPGR